jgi:predicted lipase
LVDLDVDLRPKQGVMFPFRFAPMITYEKVFNIPFAGYVTAWFGILVRIPGTDTILIAFRGTKTITDWSYDADVKAVPIDPSILPSRPDIKVHNGFQKLYMAMRNLINVAVVNTRPSNIIITGHSLGSSLATLTAFDLALQGYKIHSTYLFASPRVGNPAFVDTFNQFLQKSSGMPFLPVYRIANGADIVNQVPHPAFSTSKYEHVGSSAYSFEYIPAAEESVIEMSVSEFTVWAHSLDTYLKYGPSLIPFPILT